MAATEASNSGLWEVPYLPIDPKDLGRGYESVVRVNSQSGKGGIAYLLQRDYGLDLPRALQVAFSRVVQQHTDASGREVTPEEIWGIFETTYLGRGGYLGKGGAIELIDYRTLPDTHASEIRHLTAQVRIDGAAREIHGRGNGPIDAFIDALATDCGVNIQVRDYSEHALGTGADASAVAYVEAVGPAGAAIWGVGIDPNIVLASLRAVLGAANQVWTRPG